MKPNSNSDSEQSNKQTFWSSRMPLLGDRLIVSIPSVFILIMILALFVMSYASVQLVGKALVNSEESRVSQVALSIALELEKDQIYIEQLTKSLGRRAQSASSTTQLRDNIQQLLQQESTSDLILGGGIWSEPSESEPQQPRANFFWNRTPQGFALLDIGNQPAHNAFSESVWYLAAKYVPDACFWTSLYTNPLSGKPVITCARAMFTEGKFSGVASIDVSIASLDTYLDEHMSEVKGYALILDRNLRIIAKPERSALLKQLNFDMGEQDTIFPDYLDTLRGKPTFNAIEQLINEYQAQSSNTQLPAELERAIAGTNSNTTQEAPANLRSYLNDLNRSERKPQLQTIERDPVFAQAAQMVLVHMPQLGTYLVIVVPEEHVFEKSTSALFSLFLVMLVSISLTIVILWLWLRRILLLPLSNMVEQLRSHQGEPLDTHQKFEIRALAVAYNDKQRELSTSLKELESAHKRYQDMLHNSNEAIAVIDRDGDVIEANEALVALFSDDWERLCGSAFESHLIKDDRPAFSNWLMSVLDGSDRGQRLEAHVVSAGQQTVLMEISASISQQEGHPLVTLFMRDISARREAEREIAQMAVTDSLTGLYNRAGFTQRLEAAVQKAQLFKDKVALLFIDLDYFKEINDVRGHDAGDQLLRLVAQRLTSRRRESDVVARLGGDEFAIILNFSGARDPIGRIAAEVVSSLNKPFNLVGQEACRIGASVGISIYPDYADSVAELVRQADIAMYQAKNDGRNAWRYYAKQQAEAHQQRQKLIQDMGQALANNQFFLEYQPIIDANNQLAFLEALIRWRHPQQGVISPMDFIPLAEKTGLIVEIGNWVIETACRAISDWRKSGVPVGVVSINVSVVQLQRGNLQQALQHSIARYQLEPASLLLEVTESMLLDASYAHQLQSLRDDGYMIAIDDFGTGYSNLSYLQSHPVDCLKIDKAFVNALSLENETSLCRAIIKLSKGLGAKVIAEGVEQESQFHQLAEMQSDYQQGYWIAKPMPPSQVENWLRSLKR